MSQLVKGSHVHISTRTILFFFAQNVTGCSPKSNKCFMWPSAPNKCTVDYCFSSWKMGRKTLEHSEVGSQACLNSIGQVFSCLVGCSFAAFNISCAPVWPIGVSRIEAWHQLLVCIHDNCNILQLWICFLLEPQNSGICVCWHVIVCMLS